MALKHSEMVTIGTPAPDFALLGVDGATYRRDDFGARPVLLVAFICNHCPYVQAIDDRLVALQADYADRGLQVVAVNPNDPVAYPADSFEHMQQRAALRGYNFPYLFDATQEVARAYGAQCTPDFFLYGPDRRLAYRGRLDDNWKDRAAVVKQDLRAAIDRLLAGAAPDADQIPSMGCSIKWRE